MATEYKPGAKCEHSGIYGVEHDEKHAEPHEVRVVFGESFPPCNHCGKHPRFTLVRPAIHIASHSLFKK